MKNSLKIGAVFGAVIVSGSLSLTAASFANADISPVATVAVAQSPEQPFRRAAAGSSTTRSSPALRGSRSRPINWAMGRVSRAFPGTTAVPVRFRMPAVRAWG